MVINNELLQLDMWNLGDQT